MLAYSTLLSRFTATEGGNTADFELLCALEQLLADLRLLARYAEVELPWEPALTRLRRLVVDSADRLWLRPERGTSGSGPRDLGLPDESEVDEVFRLVARRDDDRLSEHNAARFAVPECLLGAPVDYRRYVDAARAWRTRSPEGPDDWLVVGIRTGGSYLAPLWAAVLSCAYLTVRPPKGGPDRSVLGPPPAVGAVAEDVAWPELVGLSRRWPGRRVLVVDDQLGRGMTMAASLSAIQRVGESQTAAVPVAHHTLPFSPHLPRLFVPTNVEHSLPTPEDDDEALRAYFGDALARVPAAAGLALTRVDRLGAGYWPRYLSAATGVPWTRLRASLRDPLARRFGPLFQRYRLMCQGPRGEVAVVAKYFGHGFLAGLHAEALAAAPAAPPVLGVGHGYLFCHWFPGRSLDFGGGAEVDADDLEAMAATVAELHRTAVAWLSPRRTAVWVELACARLRLDDQTFLRAIGSERPPIARAPRHHGHWHWVRADAGRLIRCHRDALLLVRHVDPAGDLAGTAIELGLSGAQIEALLRAYAASSGDEVTPGRLALGAAHHAATVLGEFDEHEAIAEALVPQANPRAHDLAPYQRRRAEVGPRAVDLIRQVLG